VQAPGCFGTGEVAASLSIGRLFTDC
jgi:hypothetical protein